MAHQFNYDSVQEPLDCSPKQWWFTCAMVSTCSPLLDKLGDNYEVEALLREDGVITAADSTDTESCQMFVYFKSQGHGEAFVDRLNAWLLGREDLLKRLRAL